MKLYILATLVVIAVANRLDSTYLPPGTARSPGGNGGNFLNAPFGGGFAAQGRRGHFGPPGFGPRGPQIPTAAYGAPSAEYGAPSGSGFNGGHHGNNFGQSPSNHFGASSGYHGGAFSGGRFGGRAQSREAGAAILRYNNEHYGDGTYRFDYETENGISQQESGELKNAGSDYESSAVEGSYSYIGDDGQTYTVNYIADENGFQPFGEHIATISQAVQTSLKKNAAEAQAGYQYNGGSRSDDGFQSGGFNGAANRQYLAPNKPSFNQQSGYQY